LNVILVHKILIEEEHHLPQVAAEAVIHQLDELHMCLGIDDGVEDELLDLASLNAVRVVVMVLGRRLHFFQSILDVQRHQTEEADDGLLLVEHVLHATFDEHWDEHFVGDEYLQEIDVSGEVPVLDWIVGDVGKVVDDSVLGEQLLCRRPGQLIVLRVQD